MLSLNGRSNRTTISCVERIKVRKVLLAGLALCLVVLGLTATAPAASAAVTLNGTVQCISGEPVVGVWVVSNTGGTGWANFTPASGLPSKASFSKSVTNTNSYYLSVGCGGNAQTWHTTNYSDTVSGNSKYFSCWDAYGSNNYAKGRCQVT